MTKVKWTDLTESEQSMFKSQCGPKRFMLRFHPLPVSCRQHDFYYTRGGDENDRKYADVEFFSRCAHNACHSEFPFISIVLALVAYIMVRVFGWMFFNYGEYLTKDEILRRNEREWRDILN
jgi:hypothetical protein